LKDELDFFGIFRSMRTREREGMKVGDLEHGEDPLAERWAEEIG
jgi:hypothetical protein